MEPKFNDQFLLTNSSEVTDSILTSHAWIWAKGTELYFRSTSPSFRGKRGSLEETMISIDFWVQMKAPGYDFSDTDNFEEELLPLINGVASLYDM